MSTYDLFYVAISTVFKVVATVVVGIYFAPFLGNRAGSEKGLSFIALRILLPSMLFGNLALDISLELLSEYYWAIIMSLVPQVLGAAISAILRKLVDKEWRVLLILGSTFQNGLVFPLSIVTNIVGIEWLDGEAMKRCQQYVFLYNLTCALGLWSIGNPTVMYQKQKLMARLADAEAEKNYLEIRRRRESELVKFRKLHKIKHLVSVGAGVRSPTAALNASRIHELNGDCSRSSTGHEGLIHSINQFAADVDDGKEIKAPRMQAGMPPMTPVMQASTTTPTLGLRPNSHHNTTAGAARVHFSSASEVSNSSSSSSRGSSCGGREFHSSSSSDAYNDEESSSSSHSSEVTDVSAPAATIRESMDATIETSEIKESLAELHHYWYRPAHRHDRPISIAKMDKLLGDENIVDIEKSRVEEDGTDDVGPPQKSAEADGKKSKKTAASQNRKKKKKKGLFHSRKKRKRITSEKRQMFYRRLETVPVPGERCFSIQVLYSALQEPPHPHRQHHHRHMRGTDDTCDPEDVDLSLHNSDRPFSFHFHRFLYYLKVAVNMPPAYISFVAIAISLIPPLRWCAETVPGLTFIGGVALVGTACVPVQLITLGCTLSSRADPGGGQRKGLPKLIGEYMWFKKPVTTRVKLNMVDATQTSLPNHQDDPQSPMKKGGMKGYSGGPITAESIIHAKPIFSFSTRQHYHHHKHHDGKASSVVNDGVIRKLPPVLYNPFRMWKSLSNATRFSIITIALRLLLLPALSFFIVHILLVAGVLPSDPPFVISILIGVSSPAAVNGSLVCTMHDYYATEYARMIFAMYCLSALSSTLWLLVSIYYAGLLVE